MDANENRAIFVYFGSETVYFKRDFIYIYKQLFLTGIWIKLPSVLIPLAFKLDVLCPQQNI